ncbi:hypothetical protein UFOVP213_29 [uncultured Caudovirales phage]|uniref:Uncharacterized protein n=1 Tax=uncultured Caudovirales phage TaxID=2100421 RepID=A0A6J7WNW8_9CAUD|nr:hypothetical protein UFOVP213_29 [uncultured Caudovirales phage]
MNIELTFMELLDLRVLLHLDIINNEKCIERYSQERYTDTPDLKIYHVDKNERLKLLLTKLENYATI